MSSRGQALLAIAVAAFVAAAGVFLDRSIGVRGRPAARSPATTSGAWLCPHGGGPKDWTVTLEVANPGTDAATLRVTSLGAEKPSRPKAYEVGPGATLAIPAEADGRGSSSFVEFFGSWVAVGWVAHAGGEETGAAAEPCVRETAATRWFDADGTSVEGEDAYLIVMNPFGAQAIFDLVLYTKDRAPIRYSEWTRYSLPPRRSVAFLLNDQALDEAAVGAELDVTRGRVAASSLGVSTISGGIRSVIGTSGDPPQRTYLAVAGEGGQSTLTALAPGLSQTQFDATLLSGDPPQPADALTDQRQGAQSAEGYQVLANGASAVDVVASGDGVIVSRRAAGLVNDTGSTGGVPGPAPAWVVMPTAACDPNIPGLALVNPGDLPAEVTLHVLPRPGQPAPPDVTVSVPPARIMPGPKDFLAADPHAAILVTASTGTVIASGASSSCGLEGRSAFAVATGIPVPS